MNRLRQVARARILGLQVEGNSLRAASRLADVSINSVTKLLVDVGAACSEYQDRALQNLPCKQIQIDDIWAFVYAKQRQAPIEKWAAGEAGDIWTWTAIDADTKLVPTWLVGRRDGDAAMRFVCDFKARLANRIQLTSDGLRFYAVAVEESFGIDVDYAQLVKHYGAAQAGPGRYSPPKITGTERKCCKENPDPAQISTSFVERHNLTMRMSMRRFTRLTNAFSKIIENHAHAVALHFMYYNFGRIHKTLRVTPAMAAGVTDHVLSLEEIASLSDQ